MTRTRAPFRRAPLSPGFLRRHPGRRAGIHRPAARERTLSACRAPTTGDGDHGVARCARVSPLVLPGRIILQEPEDILFERLLGIEPHVLLAEPAIAPDDIGRRQSPDRPVRLLHVVAAVADAAPGSSSCRPPRRAAACSRVSSTETPMTISPLSRYLFCRSTNPGISILHGPHHVAQKSSRITLPLYAARFTGFPSMSFSVNFRSAGFALASHPGSADVVRLAPGPRMPPHTSSVTPATRSRTMTHRRFIPGLPRSGVGVAPEHFPGRHGIDAGLHA